jgi:hypothetical protein
MPDDIRQPVLSLLQQLPVRRLDALKQLFWSELNYDRANQPLSTRNWPEATRQALVEPPTLLATAGQGGNFHIIYSRLGADRLLLAPQRQVVTDLLREHPYALFVFSDRGQTDWHFVNVRYEKGGDVRARRIFRRITVGPYERLRTAAERISLLDIAGLPPDLFGISPLVIQQRHDDAFDVEAVTDQFFKSYKAAFETLQDNLAAQTGDGHWAHDYALQFLNRLMFLYYIQRKRWLGDDPEFLASFWAAYQKATRPADTFVDGWLSILFFEAFNNRFQSGRADYSYLPGDIRNSLAMAPYLNGGLFEVNDLDRRHKVTITDNHFHQILIFLERYNFTISEDTPLDQEVAVDPEMIGKVYESLVNVSEEADKRGEAGIFYTPRIEIDLMCRLSLTDWLNNHMDQEHKPSLLYEAVFAFNDEDKARSDTALAGRNLWPKLNDLLRSLKVADPACGSGSFLVGMLYVLDDLLARANRQLGYEETPYERKKRIIGQSLYGVDVMEWAVHVAELRLWLQLVIDTDLAPAELKFRPLLPNLSFRIRPGDSLVQEVGGINLALRRGSRIIPSQIKGRITQLQGEKLKFYNNDPHRKYQTAQALQQAELQLFRDILDARAKAIDERLKEIADVLRPQVNLFGEVQNRQIGLERPALEREQDRLGTEREQVIRTRNALKTAKDVPFVWDIAFVEVFEGESDGFDIIMGNPPYVRQEMIRDPHQSAEQVTTESKKAYKAKLARSVYTAWPRAFNYDWASDRPGRPLDAKSDLYTYFYFHGLSLLNEKGTFCFITSNSWLDVGYGKDLQEFLLTRGRVKLVLDNQARRSFASADVNTVIVLLGPAHDTRHPQPESKTYITRFVMFTVPFEQALNPVVWEEVEESTARHTTPEYRIFPLDQATLMDSGMDPGKKQFVGDKWGGKYLRAPDIYFTALSKGQHLLRPMSEYFDGERYLNTGGADGFFILTDVTSQENGLFHVINDRTTTSNGAPFEGYIEEDYLVPLIKDYTKRDKRIEIHGFDAYCLVIKGKPSAKVTKYIQWGESQGYHQRSVTKNQKPWYKPTNQMTSSASILMPRSFNDTFVVYYNPRGYLSLRFYRLHRKKGKDQQLVAFLNSTLTALVLETLGNKNLGEGVLDFFMADFLALRLPLVEGPEIELAFRNICTRPVDSIWTEYGILTTSGGRTKAQPLPDRCALDNIIFDALGLTQGERDAVYEAVVNLVEARLKKAESLR